MGVTSPESVVLTPLSIAPGALTEAEVTESDSMLPSVRLDATVATSEI